MPVSARIKKAKSTQSVRERAKKDSGHVPKKKRISTVKLQPVKRFIQRGKKEYHLPLPDNRLGRIMKKRVRIFPKFFREAGAEVKQVTWPGRRETFRLSLAVFIFSITFGVFVAIIDYGLDRLFKEVILK